MKKRILKLGVPATHDLITDLAGSNHVPAVSDFDAFVFDPNALQQDNITGENYGRRQGEIRDLVVGKGGLVLCLLRPILSLGFSSSGRTADTYGFFDLVAPDALVQIRAALRAGWGSHVQMVSGAKGPSVQYYRVLERALRFVAYLDTMPVNLENVGGTVLALNSVPHPIGVEFAVGAGRICFVPVPEGETGVRIGSAIVRVVEAHYGGPSEIEAPPWLIEVGVPGATIHDARISELEEKKGQIEAEVGRLREKQAALLNYRVLLFGYGKSALEPAVRSAFRLLDFRVPEPDEYTGEWDVELHEPRSSITAIGEVEGSEGVIDVDKYRQLLDYVQAEALEDRDRKGVLIGNGYRLTAPDAAERQSQFSGHALRGAKKNGFALLPTTELFKAVCAVLEAPDDEGLKIRIRDSIMNAVGVWAFARETSANAARAAGVTPNASPG